MTMMARSRVSKVRVVGGTLFVVLVTALVLFAPHVALYTRALFANIVARPSDSDTYAGLSSAALRERLLQTETELAQSKYQAVLYGLLVEENESLRKAAHTASLSKGVVGRVLARPPRTHYDTLLIDVGVDDGVKENDLAVLNGFVLGRVVSVGASDATVELFSAPGTTQDVVVGTPHAVVVAKGVGGGAFEFSVPQGVKVSAGDAIRFQSSDTMALGVVRHVTLNARDTSTTVRASIPFSFSDIDFIRIISR